MYSFVIQFRRKYQHELYFPATTNYDYSILELGEAVDFTDPKMAKVGKKI